MLSFYLFISRACIVQILVRKTHDIPPRLPVVHKTKQVASAGMEQARKKRAGIEGHGFYNAPPASCVNVCGFGDGFKRVRDSSRTPGARIAPRSRIDFASHRGRFMR